MFDKLIEEIQKAVIPEIVTLGDDLYVSKPIYHLPTAKRAAVLEVVTLQAIKDYLLANVDDGDRKKLFIHVADFNEVRLCGFLNGDREREALIKAVYAPNGFMFDHNYDQETFITKIQACFEPSDERDKVLQFVGSLTDESSLKLQDDGITQQTVAKSGITTLDRVKFENPVTLAPFRTFAEIEQPDSNFVLRLHRRDSCAPTISLHEAENSVWKIEAISRIKQWLESDVKVPILA